MPIQPEASVMQIMLVQAGSSLACTKAIYGSILAVS